MEATVKKPKITNGSRNGALSFRQIRNKVGDGWAVIKDPEFNGAIFLKGELVYHSKDRLEALEEFGKCKSGTFYFKYCGKPDPNVVYIL